MKLENQVCSLEQAKRLKELGIEQKSHFVFCPTTEGHTIVNRESGIHLMWPDEHFAAFTVAELGVMLSAWLFPRHNNWMPRPNETGFDVLGGLAERQSFATEAQARAAMLIYLLENSHITPTSVNQRLSND